MNRVVVFLVFSTFIFFTACRDNDIRHRGIYYDYKVWGEEGSDSITVMLQFRRGHAQGATMALEAPAKVELDGQVLREDSSQITGPFYEIVKPVFGFAGKHSIAYTDHKGKQHTEEFDFRVITCNTPFPAQITRGDLRIELDGLNPEDYIRIVLTDTSFTGRGINRLDTVKNGQLLISKTDLEAVASGPVFLELYRESDQNIKNGTRRDGQLSITYGLKREFEIKDEE